MDNLADVNSLYERANNMCGIAGILNFGPTFIDLSDRACVMRDKLIHRGPDDNNISYYYNVALVHTRLALIDVSGGQQPFKSPDLRYTITYNGEVYNYKSLRKELEDYWNFTTHSDTEVILAAYLHWGKDCLTRFNGMFSFFIWDNDKQQGFAARDLLGIKPFVYQYRSNEFIFASEAKAIIAIQPDAPIANVSAIVEYLACPYFSGVEEPMFDGLKYLLPGHYLVISKNDFTVASWQDYELSDELTDTQQTTEQLAKLLIEGIQSTMIADVPIATYLSGGFDSTLITSIASKNTNKTLDTYTIQFINQEAYCYQNSLIINSDDTPYAIRAAKELNVNHNIVNVSHESLEESLKNIAINNDTLPAWEQEIAQHHLAKEASQLYKVVLVGDAADETHYGYQFLLDDEATQSPSGIIQRFTLPPINKSLLPDVMSYFNEKYTNLTTNAGHRWDTPSNRYLATTYLIIKRWLPRLLQNGDAHSMSHSLEARVPFADINLLNFAKRVNPKCGYKQGNEKYLLRKSSHGLLPEVFRTRKKSALPKDQETGSIYQRIASEQIKISKTFLSHFLDMEVIHKLCKTPSPLREDERSLLFRVICLSYWQQAYGVILK